MRVLLVEDDEMIGKAVCQGLRGAGFVVDWVVDAPSAESSLSTHRYDLAILDLGLPSRDGMALLRSLRARGDELPVLIASARDAVADRISGLNAGADDYMTKPFDLDEMIARAHAVVRRRAGSAGPELRAGQLSLNPAERRVTLRGVEVNLSPREFAILEALMRRPAVVLSREQLEEAVYGWGDEVGSNAVEVHLHHLRRKLGADTIRNVRGVGYRLGALE